MLIIAAKRKIAKEELLEVKECLVNRRGLKRSTSSPCVHEEPELRKRAGRLVVNRVVDPSSTP